MKKAKEQIQAMLRGVEICDVTPSGVRVHVGWASLRELLLWFGVVVPTGDGSGDVTFAGDFATAATRAMAIEAVTSPPPPKKASKKKTSQPKKRFKAPSRTRAEWRGLVRAWKASGETSATFARMQGINKNTLIWWKTALKTKRA